MWFLVLMLKYLNEGVTITRLTGPTLGTVTDGPGRGNCSMMLVLCASIRGRDVLLVDSLDMAWNRVARQGGPLINTCWLQ